MDESTILMTTRNRDDQLRRALLSIRAKGYAGVDVTVVDDASSDGTIGILRNPMCWPFDGERLDDCRPTLTSEGRQSYLCGAVFSPDSRFAAFRAFQLQRRTHRERYRKNPGAVINFGHRQVQTDVTIEQCGEICHLTDCVEPLMKACRPGRVALARVYNGSVEQMEALQREIDGGDYVYPDDFEPDRCSDKGGAVKIPYLGEDRVALYCGLERPAPLIFMGAIHKEDFLAVKGYDEEIPRAADDALANKLQARGVRFCFVGRAVAFHLQHGKS